MISLENNAWISFCKMFRGGGFPHQRFGQAFFNHFNLHKMQNSVNKLTLDRIYNAKSEPEAVQHIFSMFQLH